MCVSVPVIFVRRSAQAKTPNDIGIRIAAKTSRANIDGKSSFQPAPANSAARIPSKEYVTGISRASNCNGAGKTEIGYIMPPTNPETPSTTHLAGLQRLKRIE